MKRARFACSSGGMEHTARQKVPSIVRIHEQPMCFAADHKQLRRAAFYLLNQAFTCLWPPTLILPMEFAIITFSMSLSPVL